MELWSNCGQIVVRFVQIWTGSFGVVSKNPKTLVKPPFLKRKSPENQWFSGLGGGDKRDRTADLLNAIVRASWTQFEKMEISDKMDGFRP